MGVDGQRIDMVSIAAIEVGARLHAFDRQRMLSLADSIDAIGLKTPIQVRLLPGPQLKLVAGRHRLEAARELGWEVVPALVSEMTDSEAECVEIEENLQRGNLTVLEHGESLAKLKAIHLRLHPETAHGGNRKPTHDQEDNNVPLIASAAAALGRAVRFTKAEAEKSGLNEKAVKRLVQIGEAITPELREEIAGTALANNQAQLLALVKQPEETRLKLVKVMKAKGKTKVLDAIRDLRSDAPDAPVAESESPEAIWMRKMLALWATADTRGWQDRFLASVGHSDKGASAK